jgi:enamine deaminase RidA (YjgF/YER057c/UK114 family)
MPKTYINPPGVPKHWYFTRILTVEGPSKLVYIAGQVPSDENYKPIHVGDIRAQYLATLEALTVQLKAINATWDDVVFRRMYATDVPAFMEKCVNDRTIPLPWSKDKPSPSTLIGVTALSNPDFMIELEIVAIITD